jgi:hypothetical protein
MAVNDNELPVNNRIRIAPIIPRGITDSTIIVLLKVLNSRIRALIQRRFQALSRRVLAKKSLLNGCLL